jgi:hypothetical protein
MENVAVAFADRPKAVLAVLTAGIVPDQNPPGENSGAIVKSDTPLAQRPGMLGLIPLEFPMGMLRLKRTPRKLRRRIAADPDDVHEALEWD